MLDQYFIPSGAMSALVLINKQCSHFTSLYESVVECRNSFRMDLHVKVILLHCILKPISFDLSSLMFPLLAFELTGIFSLMCHYVEVVNAPLGELSSINTPFWEKYNNIFERIG